MFGLSLVFAAGASAHEPGDAGGVAVIAPSAQSVECDDGRPAACGKGQSLTIRGEALSKTDRVTMLGGKGRRDDRPATIVFREDHSLVIRVPKSARSGPVRVVTRLGAVRTPRVRIGPGRIRAVEVGSDALFLGSGRSMPFEFDPADGDVVELLRLSDSSVVRSWPAAADAAGKGTILWNGELEGRDAPAGRYGFRVYKSGGTVGALAKQFSVLDHMFPIRGRHDLGQGPVNGFGGGRGHQGQDMFASCGTRLVAARGGVVIKSTFHSRAGNYVVIRRPDGQSYAYMHMRKRALVREGEEVLTGQPIGEVGETGRASGCHLHFELWTSPGWYLGGKPIDPLPLLRQWDAWS